MLIKFFSCTGVGTNLVNILQVCLCVVDCFRPKFLAWIAMPTHNMLRSKCGYLVQRINLLALLGSHSRLA